MCKKILKNIIVLVSRDVYTVGISPLDYQNIFTCTAAFFFSQNDHMKSVTLLKLRL